MQSLTKSLLPMLAVLAYAGTASALSVTAEEQSSGSGPDGSYQSSDLLEIDVIIDTEGTEITDSITGFTMMVLFDDTVFSTVSVGNNEASGFTTSYYSPYIYPNSFYPDAPSGWYLGGHSFVPLTGSLNVATLVFHVMDLASSTLTEIDPSFDDVPDGGVELFVLGYRGVKLEAADMAITSLSVDVVPEPAAAALVLAAIGTLALLRARWGSMR
jgi:hypothetical protein